MNKDIFYAFKEEEFEDNLGNVLARRATDEDLAAMQGLFHLLISWSFVVVQNASSSWYDIMRDRKEQINMFECVYVLYNNNGQEEQ